MIVYFDSAASYPMLVDVADAMDSANRSLFGNPSSPHQPGTRALDSVESCRALLAESIGAANSEIIFTSGATESNNIALKAHFSLPSGVHGKHLVISAIEHKCVHAIAQFLSANLGVQVSTVMPNRKGLITTEAIESALQPNTSLVSVMHVNNETGVANPIKEIGSLCFDRGIKFHTDAAQGFLKAPIDVDDMNIDYASFSAHKIGGPKGIGAVFIREQRKLAIEPTIHGAGQEEGIRGGTVAAPLLVGFQASIEHFPKAYRKLKQEALKHELMAELEKHRVSHRVNGDGLPSIVSLTLPETDIHALLLHTSDEFALATGSACSSREIEPSHVLSAIGLNRVHAQRTLRISFHHMNSTEDILLLVSRIAQFTDS